MKILQIIYNLSPGGAERFTVDLSNELANLGQEVVLCILRDDTIGNNGFYKKDLAKNVKYINLGIPPGFKPGNIFRLYKVISTEKPNIVHCHLNLVNYIFPLTYVFPNVKFFHTIHNDAEREVRRKLELNLRKRFYSRLKVKAITISGETTKSFLKFYGFESYKEILNGRSFPEPTSEFDSVKKEIKNRSKSSYLHVGRFSTQKNQRMLINVFNRLEKNGVKINLYLIGPGFDSDDAKELRKSAGENIYFLGEKNNIADYFMASDAFCLSSIHEGMPITVIEALACGCIPVCTPVGGIKEMIADGKTGFLSDSLSEDDYYDTIIRSLNEKDKIDKKDLTDAFKANYHINVCAKNYLDIYNI
jgi:glycosyltransferase involved in cell wall biosynthesis